MQARSSINLEIKDFYDHNQNSSPLAGFRIRRLHKSPKRDVQLLPLLPAPLLYIVVVQVKVKAISLIDQFKKYCYQKGLLENI